VLIIASVAIYFPPAGAGSVYLICWLLVLYAGYSMLTLSQAGWGAALVAEYHQRSRVYGWIQAVAVVGLFHAHFLEDLGSGWVGVTQGIGKFAVDAPVFLFVRNGQRQDLFFR